jgi:uncharacterized protein DUF6527
MSRSAYIHRFVKAFPDQLEDGILYVSVEFSTAAHLCFCGCGSEVYTRFSPRDWSMSFNGETVSLKPSIGNWSFPCKSHYVLSGGRVNWADRWSRERIELGRTSDRERKERYYRGESAPLPTPARAERPTPNLLVRLAHWLVK